MLWTEFSNGIFKVIAGTTRLLVYTLGHIIICVVSVVTGVSLWEAGIVALVEPTISMVSGIMV